MDAKYIVVLILVAGLIGGVSNNYIGDYLSNSSDEEMNDGTTDQVKVADGAQGNWIYAIGSDEMTTAFEAERSPTVVIIDKEGIISFSKQGTLSEEDLEKEVNSALN